MQISGSFFFSLYDEEKKNVILNSRDWRVNRNIGTERTSLGSHGVWGPLNS